MLARWKKSYDKPRQHIQKQRHYFSDKGPYSQSYGFSRSYVQIWEWDHKAKHWRIDAFGLWYWRRLLRVPWIARRSNQSILKEINPDSSLKGLMLKLKLQYSGHLMQRADSLEKTMILGKTEGGRRTGRQDEMIGWHHRLNAHEFEQTPGDSKGQGKPGVLQFMGLQSQTGLSDWTTIGKAVCSGFLGIATTLHTAQVFCKYLPVHHIKYLKANYQG